MISSLSFRNENFSRTFAAASHRVSHKFGSNIGWKEVEHKTYKLELPKYLPPPVSLTRAMFGQTALRDQRRGGRCSANGPWGANGSPVSKVPNFCLGAFGAIENPLIFRGAISKCTAKRAQRTNCGGAMFGKRPGGQRLGGVTTWGVGGSALLSVGVQSRYPKQVFMRARGWGWYKTPLPDL